MGHLDIPCHCCNVIAAFFDDFGYCCSKCGEVHCPVCCEPGDKCKKCTQVEVQKECVACQKKPIKSRKIHKHHVNWRRFGYPENGRTIALCSMHHPSLHKWIENEAIKMCIANDSKFFETMTDKYMNEYLDKQK